MRRAEVIVLRLFELQSGRRRGMGGGERCVEQQPRQAPRHVQQRLGKTDVGQQQAGGHVRLNLQRRQGLPAGRQRPFTGLQPQRLQGVWGDPGAPRRVEERDHLRLAQALPRHRAAAGQRHRIDAHQLQAPVLMPLELHPPLHHRRHRPAGAAQLGKQRLGKLAPSGMLRLAWGSPPIN